MKRMKGMTAEERSIFWCAIQNLSQEVAYRVRRYNEAQDEGLNGSIRKRREREMFQAVEQLAVRYDEGISDAALRYFSGEEAVKERDKRRGKSGKVVPLKRAGFVVTPPPRNWRPCPHPLDDPRISSDALANIAATSALSHPAPSCSSRRAN
jgi:hypothetical protein